MSSGRLSKSGATGKPILSRSAGFSTKFIQINSNSEYYTYIADNETKEDLYTWMARQQELERNKTKREGSFRSRDVNLNTNFTNRQSPLINPFDLSLATFFDVFYETETLDEQTNAIYALFLLGDRMNANFQLFNVEVALVEPKVQNICKFTTKNGYLQKKTFFQFSGHDGGMKNISFIDRPFVSIDSCSCRSTALFSIREQTNDTKNNEQLNRGKKDTVETMLHINQDLSYDLSVKTCSILAGFTGLAFINEVSAIGRSVAETLAELVDDRDQVK